MRVFVYVRVSTQEQAREGYSIGEQIERLQNYCKAMGWIIVKIYTDAGESGATIDRPALQEMIEDVKAGKANKVVVYKLDRLSRSQKDTLMLIEDVFLANDCDFVSMNENFDTSTPFGRAMIGILAVFAQLEREQIKERMTMGKDARAKEGKWNGGGTTPIGYDYCDGVLKVIEFEAMQVRELFEEYTNGKPLKRIMDEFEEKGYRMRGGLMDSRNFRYILSNKTYLGYIRHRDQWYKGDHEPIIDEETFEKANERLEEGRARYRELGYRTGTSAQSTYLGGFLYCKQCGARFGKNQTGSKKYGYHFNYTCYSRHKKVKKMIKDPNCKNKFYRVEVLDEIIFNEIRKLALEPDKIHAMIDEKPKTDDEQKIALMQKEIKSLDEQVSRFMDLYGLGKFNIEQLDSKIAPLEKQKHQLQDEIKSLQATDEKMPIEEAIEVIQSFSDILDRGNFDEIRGVIEALIERIDIDNDDIEIHWNFV